MLMRYRSHLSPLRVYGNAIESMDFPYPGSSLHISQKALRDSKPKQEIRYEYFGSKYSPPFLSAARIKALGQKGKMAHIPGWHRSQIHQSGVFSCSN